MSKNLLILLASVCALTPYAIDSYLPAITVIAHTFSVETSMVSITVSIYIFGMAIGQLIGGPLSDRLGRKPIMVAGLLLFALCSVLIARSTSIELFWGWRVIQSIGAGIATVGVPAAIRDNAEGKEAAKLFSLIGLISLIAPSIAPSVGTTVMNMLNWQWIFHISGILGIILAIYTFTTMPKAKQIIKAKSTLSSESGGGFWEVLQQRQAMGYLIAQAFGFAMLMTFLTNSPYVYMVHFGVSAELFSTLMVFNVGGVVLVNRLNSYLLNRFEPSQLLVGFLVMQLIGVTLLILSLIFAPNNLWFAVASFVISIASIGGVMPNTSASFMQFFKHNAGTASALLGSLQSFIGAFVSGLAALLTVQSLWPMALIMLLSSGIALAGIVFMREPYTSCAEVA